MTDTAGREGVPSPTLQVIGAGFGRTGTASMRDAQVRLGFGPCDHMAENFEHQERFALWDEARQRKHAGEPINWQPLLTGFPAIVDWPGAYFWEELTAAHPEANVIPTVRDPKCWYDSISATIFTLRDDQLPERSAALPGRLCSTQSSGEGDDCPREAAGLRCQGGVGAALCIPGRPRSGRRTVSPRQ
jgi:hypothetical protein